MQKGFGGPSVGHVDEIDQVELPRNAGGPAQFMCTLKRRPRGHPNLEEWLLEGRVSHRVDPADRLVPLVAPIEAIDVPDGSGVRLLVHGSLPDSDEVPTAIVHLGLA